MGGLPADVREAPRMYMKQRRGCRMSCDVDEAAEGLKMSCEVGEVSMT